MSHIFISYSRKDKIFAGKLTQELEQSKLETWIDWEDIPPVTDFLDQIFKGIESADGFLILLSPDSVKSEVCFREIEHAVQNGKRLIPLVVRDVNPGEVHPVLAKLNWIFFREQDNFEEAVRILLSAIRTDLEWVEAQRRLQVRAIEWDENKDRSLLLRGKDLREAEEQLASAGQKDPQPTDLQRQYILESRRGEIRSRNLLLIISAAVMMLLGIASLIAVRQSNFATEQAKIARAGELAAMSMNLHATRLSLSLLLGIESYKLDDNLRTRTALLDNVNTHPEMRQTLIGHSSMVKGVSFSPDGQILASVSCADYDIANDDCLKGEIILWDMTADQPIPRSFIGHSGWIFSMAFNPVSNIDMLATGSSDDTILLWETKTGKQIEKPLIKHTNDVTSVAFNPEGNLLASGDKSGLLILWTVEDQQPSHLFQSTGPIASLAFSPDGKTLAFTSCENYNDKNFTICEDNKIILLDVETRKFIGKPLLGHTDLIKSITFSPNGEILASGSHDNTIILWDMTTLQKNGKPLHGHQDWVYSVIFIDDKTLASGSTDHTIILWDVGTQQQKGEILTGHSNWVNTLAISPDQKILASGSDDNTILLWNLGDNRPFGTPLMGHQNIATSVAFSPNNQIIASGSFDGTIILWSRDENHEQLDQLNTGLPVVSIAFTPDGKLLASGNLDGTIDFWDIDTLQRVDETLIGHSGPVEGLSFSNDGKLLASSSDDGTAIIWNLETYQKVGNPIDLPSEYNETNILVFNPKESHLVAYENNKNLNLRNITTEEVDILPGHSDAVGSVAFSPDGKTVATGSYGNIFLWDLSTDDKVGVPLTSQTSNIGTIESLAISPDGKTLASNGCGNFTPQGICKEYQLFLWDMVSGQLIGQLQTGETDSFAIWLPLLTFSIDGKILASTGCGDFTEEGCKEGQVLLWDVDPESWIEKSCLRAGRNITRAEWAQYFPNEEYRASCPEWPLEVEPTPMQQP